MFDQVIQAGMLVIGIAAALAALAKGLAELAKGLAAWRAAGRKTAPITEHQTITRSSLPPPGADEVAGLWKALQAVESDCRVLRTRQDGFEKHQDRILTRLNGHS